ncbi:MAG: family 20 glycosylhydrolase [Alloprevotella sp.]|nr:family 20 glycosylhydrolase [Alloprevotella sp.]
MRKSIFLLLSFCLFLSMKAQQTEFNFIPKPRIVTPQQGSFTFSAQTQVAWRGEEAEGVAKFFCQKLERATSLRKKPVRLKKEGKKQPVTSNVVRFIVDANVEGPETYRLEVTPEAVTAYASTSAGLFYAMQTLFQLMPTRIEAQTAITTPVNWQLPCVTVDDAPRFRWRGVHLDPCRHFLPVAAVKKQIDMLATLKINKLHFHLTDDQGWRIEIKKYPELTRVGARRLEGEGTWHEGFYTQEQIRDIVSYAAERHVEVVPELELPGHGLAAIAAYPELSCRGDSLTPRIIWGVEDIVMCPGKENMFTFLRDVIDEMVPLFPSQYFHIGGDESPRGEWKTCPLCQQRMASLGFEREAQLQDYVIERVAKYLATKGKAIIGWDEILEGGNLEPSAIVMSWRGEKGGIEAANKEHRVIMTPSSQGLYFDHYQGDPITEPTAIGGFAPLEKVYSYDPVPEELKANGKGRFVLGVQGNNWSEYYRGPSQMEYHLYPRALALAEIAWTPAAMKDYDDFLRRVDGDATMRLAAHNINFHIPQPEIPGVSSNRLAFTSTMKLPLTTTRPLPILYTTDGTSPTTDSPRYTGQLAIDRTTTVKTAVMLPCGLMGPVRTIFLSKQQPAPAVKPSSVKPGLELTKYRGDFRTPEQLRHAEATLDSVVTDLRALPRLTYVPGSVRNVDNYAAVAEGYVRIPEDGVYEFSTCNAQLIIDGRLQIDNSRVYAPRDTRENVELALAKGLHRVKVIFLGGIFGGWPTYWNDGTVRMRPSRGKWQELKGDFLCH